MAVVEFAILISRFLTLLTKTRDDGRVTATQMRLLRYVYKTQSTVTAVEIQIKDSNSKFLT